MRLYLFDLDQTLTFLHIGHDVYVREELSHIGPQDKRTEFYKGNMKPGVFELFQVLWASGAAIGIPTFSNEYERVKKHFSAIGFTEEQFNQIFFEYRPQNFVPNETTKRALVHNIIARVEAATGEKVTEVVYADDGQNNLIDIAPLLAEVGIAYKPILVPRMLERGEQGQEVDRRSDFIQELHATLAQPITTPVSLRAICTKFFQDTRTQMESLNTWKVFNGRKKYRMTRDVITVVETAINNIPEAELTEARVNQVLDETRAGEENKTVKEALLWQRWFSLFAEEKRESPTSYQTICDQARFLSTMIRR